MNKEKRKCGIVTFHSSHNYGSVLQAYALVKTIQKLGLDTEIIDFRHPHTTDMYEWRLWSPYKDWKWNLREFILRGIFKFGKKREKVFNNFIEYILPKSSSIKSKSDIPDIYDILICGSDQIWNPNASGENDPIYYLDFGTTANKFSYAASSGSVKFGESNHDYILGCLQMMKSIGVREEFMKDYILQEFQLQAEVNPDPTFLLNQTEWTQIEEIYPHIPTKYLLVYTIQHPKETLSYAKSVAQKLNIPLVHICNERGITSLLHKETRYSLMNVSPQQFLWLFHHANFIVTNTFHGNMFSIIFRKNFIHYAINPNDTRISTLHETIGLGHSRMIQPNTDVNMLEYEIDYCPYESSIQQYIQKGINFITKNL